MGSKLAQRQASLQQWEASMAGEVAGREREVKVAFEPGPVLVDAVCSHDGTLEQLVRTKGLSPNAHNHDGLTPFHVAVLEEDMEAFQLLLAEGADVNQADSEMWTALHLVCKLAAFDFLEVLLQHPLLEPLPVNLDGDLPSDIADAHLRPPSTPSRGGAGAAAAAAAARDEEDEDEEDEDKVVSPEDAARLRERLDRFYALRGLTPKDFAAAKERPQERMLEYLRALPREELGRPLQDETGATLLHVAVSRGFARCVEHLLRQGEVDVNARDRDGWTPLHCAAYWGYDDLVRTLHEAGAKLGLTHGWGALPSEVATNKSTIELLETLATTARVSSPFAGALGTWKKLKWSLKFVVGLWEAHTRASAINRKTLRSKDLTTKRDMAAERQTMQNKGRFPGSDGDPADAAPQGGPETAEDATLMAAMEAQAPAKQPAAAEDEAPEESAAAKRSKRRTRRSTGVNAGPQIEVVSVTSSAMVIKWDDKFTADWFNVYLSEAASAQAPVLAKSQILGPKTILTKLKPKTEYILKVIPGQGDEEVLPMTSILNVTTSEL